MNKQLNPKHQKIIQTKYEIATLKTRLYQLKCEIADCEDTLDECKIRLEELQKSPSVWTT